MTPERRQEILSSDVLGIKELGELLDLQGKILIQDYINYFKLDISRYTPTVELAASANANAKE